MAWTHFYETRCAEGRSVKNVTPAGGRVVAIHHIKDTSHMLLGQKVTSQNFDWNYDLFSFFLYVAITFLRHPCKMLLAWAMVGGGFSWRGLSHIKYQVNIKMFKNLCSLWTVLMAIVVAFLCIYNNINMFRRMLIKSHGLILSRETPSLDWQRNYTEEKKY